MARLHGVAFLLMALSATASWACWMPPAQQLMSVEEQIKLAADVSVVQVVSVVPLADGNVGYRMRVLQQLAGPSQDALTVTAWAKARSRNGKDSSFEQHTDAQFWQRGGGRLMNDTDCVIYPTFVVGDSYLIFLGSPVTRRSFEKIDVIDGRINEDDKWLAFVKAGLGSRSKPEAP